MKFLATVLLTSLATVVQAKFKVVLSVSDKWVQAGNVDLFAATWQEIYVQVGNKESVTIDRSRAGHRWQCNDGGPGDITLNTYIQGNWDDVGGNHHEMRDALVQAVWKALQETSRRKQYDIFTDCCFTDPIQPNCPLNTLNPPFVCTQDTCSCQSGAGHARCKTRTFGHEVPSHINAWIYEDGRATANSLHLTFDSHTVEQSDNCGIVGSLVGSFASFIFPGILGTVIEAGIDLSCA